MHQSAILEFILQLGFIIIIAKLAGEFCERWLRQPAVLGELVVGIIVGPFALGGYKWFGAFQLFPPKEGMDIPVSNELWALAQFAVIIFLFTAGLDTDFSRFLKLGFHASGVALGGVVFPFVFGAYATACFTHHSFTSPEALFMGAALTATSISLTARVLQDLNRFDTPEGVVIIGAAVIDDVLGILVLGVVIALSQASAAMTVAGSLLVAGKALIIWLCVTTLLVLIAPVLEKIFLKFVTRNSPLVLGIGLCFVVAFFVETFHLAMIIGAYAVGLGFARTPAVRTQMLQACHTINSVLAPIFFVVMGMLVNVPALLGSEIFFGIILTLLAIAGKLFGCGVPAYMSGFTMRSSTRIGLGMLPRGEVGLIIAGMGMAYNAIDSGLFGVVVMMVMITTMLAPIGLVSAFKGKGGFRRSSYEWDK